MNQPIAYFLTWTTYGTWLHGDERGSIERGEGHVRTSERRRLAAEALMTDDPVCLTPEQRALVHAVIVEHCAIRDWALNAYNVRTMHVHAVVSAPVDGKQIRNQLKAWAARRLSEQAGLELANDKNGARRWWTEKGDVEAAVWDERHLQEVIAYVTKRQ